MKKKIICIALTAVMASSVLMLTSCNNKNNKNTEPTESKTEETTTKKQKETKEDEYPGLDLKNYKEGKTKAEAENDAVSKIGKDTIDESIKKNELVEKTEFDSPIIHTFDNGIVAEYKVKIKVDGKELEVTMLAYYITIKQPNGSYKTYYIGYEEIGQANDIPEEDLEKLLQAQIDKIKKEEPTTSKDDKQEPTEAPTEKKTNADKKPTTKPDDPTEGSLEKIEEVTDNDIEF